LYALPPELFKKSSLPLKAKNHHALWSFGGCVSFIKKDLSFHNINTLNFARLFTCSYCRLLVKQYFPFYFAAGSDII